MHKSCHVSYKECRAGGGGYRNIYKYICKYSEQSITAGYSSRLYVILNPKQGVLSFSNAKLKQLDIIIYSIYGH